MRTALIALVATAALGASVTPASAIALVVGPRCEYRNGGPAVDSNGAGVLTAGPLVPTQELAMRITVTCTVQVGSAEPLVGERLRAQQTTPGTAGVLVHATTNGPSGDLYVCTSASWTVLSGSWRTWRYDADPFTPGNQCARVS